MLGKSSEQRAKISLQRMKPCEDERTKKGPHKCSHYFSELLTAQPLNMIPLCTSIGEWWETLDLYISFGDLWIRFNHSLSLFLFYIFIIDISSAVTLSNS